MADNTVVVRNTQPNCPNCRQLDASQKVSSIISTGISSTTYSSKSQQITSLSSTGLAAKLAFPERPKNTNAFTVVYWCIIFPLAALFVFTFIPSLLITTSILYSKLEPLSPGYNFLNSLILVVSFVVSLLLVIFIYWCIFYGITKGLNKIFSPWEKETKERVNRQDLAWKHIDARYKQLYYCHRCDRVFIPGQPQSSPADKLMDFLSQGI